jgi:hypothetical protein
MPAMCNALASRREWSSNCETLKVLCALVTMPLGASQGVAWLVNNLGEGGRQADTPRSHVLDLEYLLSCLSVRTRRHAFVAGLKPAR